MGVAQIAARVHPATGWLSARTEIAGVGWTRLDELLRTDADGNRPGLETWRAELDLAIEDDIGQPPAPIVAFVRTCEYVLSVVGIVAAVGFGDLRRVPDLSPVAVSLRLHPAYPYPAEIGLHAKRFWCLPQDQQADDPDAVVTDLPGLAAVVREQVGAVARSLLDWTVSGIHLGAHQRWGLATDILDQALLDAARASGRRPESTTDGAILLGSRDVPYPPLVLGSTLYAFDDPLGRRQWTRERITCCYSFRLPEPYTVVCLTCPRTPAATREAAAATWDDEGRPLG